jgi:NTP pyrophosphatase (non-canonical NTP hydrolase)
MDSNIRPYENTIADDIVQDVLSDVFKERERQISKWGHQRHMPDTWISILGEEYGEACKANNEGIGEEYRKELIETAAVAVAAVEAYDRGFWMENSANASISG